MYAVDERETHRASPFYRAVVHAVDGRADGQTATGSCARKSRCHGYFLPKPPTTFPLSSHLRFTVPSVVHYHHRQAHIPVQPLLDQGLLLGEERDQRDEASQPPQHSQDTRGSCSNSFHHSILLVAQASSIRTLAESNPLSRLTAVTFAQVIATKTKICLVMEYVPGGQLSDKLSYLKRLDEREAKKYFYQLIDAVDYCHRRGVFHRDLKCQQPENLLLDNQGNLKVSDFGLSVLRKVVIQHKTYDGAAADIWSCGVILFELLAGYLPFQDCSLIHLYRRYALPQWITLPQKKIILRILDPSPITRAKINDIFDDEWFQEGYNPSVRRTGSDDGDDCVDLDEAGTDSDGSHSTEVREAGGANPEPEQFINAFRLIATCRDLDLSGLFQEQKTKLGSPHSVQETLGIITAAARDVSLSARRMGSSMVISQSLAIFEFSILNDLEKSQVKLQDIRLLSRSMLDLTLSAEVIQVTPAHCVVEVSKSSGDLRAYKEFCTSLCRLLTGRVQQHGTSSGLETNQV
ncbi:CBL-interacting serine/threonine-protein kinase 21 [Triticum urartu]|uniref:non-specific serine/threonine protein kinase n=1 Tax=Triticum urartu TaxID=4572 RepID=M7YKT4_TRIUA|nr:CBL-interacting serine/threonine-protein kinase 21 [Triticum urartu]